MTTMTKHIYINTGNEGFRTARNGEYVDKSALIAVINQTLNTERMFSCVSRCRRFGKSMAAKMLNAYYDQSCDSHELFQDLAIASDPSYRQHLNKYPVIYLDMTDFVTRDIPHGELVGAVERILMNEMSSVYPEVSIKGDDDLMDQLIRITQHTGQKFIMIIDEWDAICRELSDTPQAMDRYVNLLRRLFKGSNTMQVFAGVYMTGILPIKKYNTQSALNNFTEYSMVMPGRLAGYFGFTKQEVKMLTDRHGMDYNELERWYDGYQLGDITSVFNPNSVMQAVYNNYCESYWGSTGSYNAVAHYIRMNFDGLKDDIIRMLSGEHVTVDASTFQNDMSIVSSRDDVLTLLIHLGYLSYDRQRKECYIPNKEVAGEMANAVKENSWKHVAEALEASKALLQSTLDGDADAVARGIETVHDDGTSILSYNNENSLACVLSLAYYYARNDYVVHREYATGKGFADLVLIPRRGVDSPAIIIELKYGDSAQTAISQIKSRQYSQKVGEYAERLLLVGICYDKTTKLHECIIERA